MPETIDLRKTKKRGRDPDESNQEFLPARPESLPETELSEEILLHWEALEFEPDPNRDLILLGLGGLLIAGAVAAFFLQTFIFGAMLLISGGLIASYVFRQPRRLHTFISGRGVTIENRQYEFQDLKSFWIFYDPPLWKDLSLESKKTLMPRIKIPLDGQNPLRLREILLRFLPEVEHQETLTDIISKRLGF